MYFNPFVDRNMKAFLGLNEEQFYLTNKKKNYCFCFDVFSSKIIINTIHSIDGILSI